MIFPFTNTLDCQNPARGICDARHTFGGLYPPDLEKLARELKVLEP